MVGTKAKLVKLASEAMKGIINKKVLAFILVLTIIMGFVPGLSVLPMTARADESIGITTMAAHQHLGGINRYDTSGIGSLGMGTAYLYISCDVLCEKTITFDSEAWVKQYALEWVRDKLIEMAIPGYNYLSALFGIVGISDLLMEGALIAAQRECVGYGTIIPIIYGITGIPWTIAATVRPQSELDPLVVWDVSPESINWFHNPEAANSTLTRTLTIYNLRNEPLTGIEAKITPTPGEPTYFEIDQEPPSTIEANGSATFTIKLTENVNLNQIGFYAVGIVHVYAENGIRHGETNTTLKNRHTTVRFHVIDEAWYLSHNNISVSSISFPDVYRGYNGVSPLTIGVNRNTFVNPGEQSIDIIYTRGNDWLNPVITDNAYPIGIQSFVISPKAGLLADDYSATIRVYSPEFDPPFKDLNVSFTVSNDPSLGAIAGIVTGKPLGSNDSNTRIAEANVVLYDTETGVLHDTLTDVNGTYSFDNVPAGRYAMFVTKQGYIAQEIHPFDYNGYGKIQNISGFDYFTGGGNFLEYVLLVTVKNAPDGWGGYRGDVKFGYDSTPQYNGFPLSMDRYYFIITRPTGTITAEAEGVTISKQLQLSDFNSTCFAEAEIMFDRYHEITFYPIDSNGSLSAIMSGSALELISPADVQEGKDVIFTAIPNSGYRVKEWTSTGTPAPDNSSDTYILENISADTTVLVEFESIPATAHEITFFPIDSNGSLTATVDGSPITSHDNVEAGKNVVFTATPNYGYRVKEWKLDGMSIDGNTINTYTLVSISADTTVSVEFELMPVTTHEIIFYPVDSYGSLSATVYGIAISSPTNVQAGKDVVLIAEPDSGYRVKEWTSGGTVVAGNASNTYTLQNISTATTVTVAFELIPPPTFAVTVSSAGTGASGSGHYAQGATVNIGAGLPPNGEQFTYWLSSPSAVSIADVNSAKTSFIMPGEPVTVTANFEPIPPGNIAFSAIQMGGASGTADSTGIQIIFSEAVSGLTANDITVTNNTGAVVKGGLTGSGAVYTISLTEVIVEGSVTISIRNFGAYTMSNSPQAVFVYKNANIPLTNVAFSALQVGGVYNTTDSTGIEIIFDQGVTGLTANDISITNGTGTVVKGTLSGTGGHYILSLSNVTTQGEVTVSIGNFGTFNVTTPPQAVAVFKDITIPATDVTFTVAQVGGISGTADSTGLKITFDHAVNGLTANDITLINGSGVVVKGSLSGVGKDYTLSLASVNTQGNITVHIGNFGSFNVITPPQAVAVYKNAAVPLTNVTFTAVQVGGAINTANSTGIQIVFSGAVSGLTINDITVTNRTGAVVHGALSGIGAVYMITLNNVLAQGDVSVSIGNFGMFNVLTAPQTVAVYKNITMPPTSGTVLYGDLNNDRVVDMADLILMLRYFAQPGIAINLAAADVNGHGGINTADLILFLRYFAQPGVVLGY